MTKNNRNPLKTTIRRTFTVLLQNSSDLVICLDLDLCILQLSNVAAKTHRWRREEVLRRNYMELCSKSGLTNPFSCDPAKILAGKKITHHKSTFLHPDQTENIITWSITRLLDDKKEPCGILMVGQDITDLRDAWAQVYHLDSIIKYAPGLIYYWKNKESIHLGCNNTFADLAGLKSREEVVGKTDFDFAWKNQADSYRADDRDVIETGKLKSNIEDLLVGADGKLRTVLANKVPLRNIEGNIIGVLCTAIDVTERKAAEQAILEAKDRAELANQAKSNFLGTMSHELRTPLNAILGMIQIMENKNPSDEQRDCIKIIRSSGLNLLTLINDILDFARLEAGRLEIASEIFDLHELVDEVMASLQHQFDSEHIKLTLEYSHAVPQKIMLDSRRLRQILFNLTNNAIKFTEEGEIKVVITCLEQTVSQATLRITITDTGIGIPGDKLEQIFERFTQVDSRYSRRFEGLGLGLSTSKQLIESMGGSIGVVSKIGEGSCFWIEFPTYLPQAQEFAQQNEEAVDLTEASQSVISEPYILLVEDNPLNQKVAKSMLEKLGCSLDIADTGEKALTLFEENDYHLVFMDIGLPGMDGLTVTRKIRKRQDNKANLPIIALTAHVLDEDQANCLKAGADKVITKPIMEDVLETTLNQWVGKMSVRKATTADGQLRAIIA